MLPYAGYADPESTSAIGVHHDGHLEATERTSFLDSLLLSVVLRHQKNYLELFFLCEPPEAEQMQKGALLFYCCPYCTAS